MKSIIKKVRNILAGSDATEKAAPAEAPVQEKKSQPQQKRSDETRGQSNEKQSGGSKPRNQNRNRGQGRSGQEKQGSAGQNQKNGENQQRLRQQNRDGEAQERSERGDGQRRHRNNRRKQRKEHTPKCAETLMSTVKEKRGGQQEEWRPGTSKPQSGSESGNKDQEARANQEQQQDGQRRRRRRGGRGRGRGEGGEPNKPREGEKRENSKRRPPSPQKGKGFKFPRQKAEHGDWDGNNYQVDEQEGKTRFTDLGLPSEVLHAISDLGYQYCTPIQAGILPQILNGTDGTGQAQTGTGKTAAFLLTGLTHILKNPKENQKNGTPRMLVLAPTRELVLQIEEEAAELLKYSNVQSLPVYGGLDYDAQRNALQENVVDLVVATPGRLLDFMRNRIINLKEVEILVLDEADRMLDMGFIPDVKRIVYATPHKDQRQTLFFSATFTDDVRRLADSWTKDAVSVTIEPESVAADTVEQTVYIVPENEKFALVVNLLRERKPTRCLIFANRRDSSQRLADRLKDYDFETALLTGAVPQARRVKVLERFKDGTLPVLVATDVAGRGIHVDDVDLVINFNLPEDPEDYVHRIGRTGRAGSEGQSICFACEFDSMMIPDIEKYLGRDLKCSHPEEEWLKVEDRPVTHRSKSNSGGGGGRGGRGGGGRGRGRGGPRGGGGRGRGPRR